MRNNKASPAVKARRIYDHYRAVAEEMMLEFRDNAEYVKRLSDVQLRKAKGGKVLGIGKL